MLWNTIDSQADLDALDKCVCWEDSHTIEYYALTASESFFPSDTSLSGGKNIHILCNICSCKAAYVEMVWINCGWFSSTFLNHPHMNGHVGSLKQIEILDHRNDIAMQCSRLIYRFLGEKDVAFLHDGKKCRVQFSIAEIEEESVRPPLWRGGETSH